MTRPRGFAHWEPKPDTIDLLRQVNGVLQRYREHLPLTVRQVFYSLVATYGYDKTEKAYARLCEHLVRARRAGYIKFEDLRDDGVNTVGGFGYSGPSHFVRSVERWASDYERDVQIGQDVYVELWCEAEGMMPQLERAVEMYTVPVYSSGGFLSVTATYETAKRALKRDVPTVLLHIGDYDPSGESIFTALAEDVSAFVQDRGGDAPIPIRVALTEAQVEHHNLPTAPPKRSDSRSVTWHGETCQCESLPPDVLADYARLAVEREIDTSLVEEIRAEEAVERDDLIEKVRGLL